MSETSETYVLLHGFTGGPESFSALVAELPTGARVLAPTLAGHGPAPSASVSWEAEVERLTRWLAAERVEGAHLCGYSLGGRIGWGLLASAPERITRATLIGAHPGLPTPAAREARRAQDRRWIDLLEAEGLDPFLAAWAALPLWESQASLPREVREAQDRVRRQHRAPGLAQCLRTLGLAEMPPASPAIEAPVTLVVGALDTHHLALSSGFARELPRARCHVVEGAGHNVLLERPDVLARVLTGDAA